MFVADFSNGRVQVFDRDGKFVRKFGQFHSIGHLAVSIGRLILVCDPETERLRAFRPEVLCYFPSTCLIHGKLPSLILVQLCAGRQFALIS